MFVHEYVRSKRPNKHFCSKMIKVPLTKKTFQQKDRNFSLEHTENRTWGYHNHFKISSIFGTFQIRMFELYQNLVWLEN